MVHALTRSHIVSPRPLISSDVTIAVNDTGNQLHTGKEHKINDDLFTATYRRPGRTVDGKTCLFLSATVSNKGRQLLEGHNFQGQKTTRAKTTCSFRLNEGPDEITGLYE